MRLSTIALALLLSATAALAQPATPAPPKTPQEILNDRIDTAAGFNARLIIVLTYNNELLQSQIKQLQDTITDLLKQLADAKAAADAAKPKE